MQQRHGFGGQGGELRVSLPRVGGPAPAPLSGKRVRGGPASWVVPLPAALALLALLAVVFQYQLLQCINEADRLVRPDARFGSDCAAGMRCAAAEGLTRSRRAQDVDSQQCRSQLDQAADDLAALRRTNTELMGALRAASHAHRCCAALTRRCVAQARWRPCAAS